MLAASSVPASGCVPVRQVEMVPAEVPPVASIPVAPLPAASLRPLLAAEARPADGAPSPSETPAVAPALDLSRSPTLTAEPLAAAPAPHVVLVDEPPYRRSLLQARRAKEGSFERERDRGLAPAHERSTRGRHAEPDVVVGVTNSAGARAIAAVERTAGDAGDGPFRRCYEEALRRDQRLSGTVSLDLELLATGAIGRAGIASATVRDESVVLCIGREAERLVFPAASSAASLRLDVRLAAGDEPIPVPKPVPNADALRDALRSSWPAVQQCYATELARRPDAGGRIELRFRAKPSGEIVEVAEEGTRRFPDVDVTRCVLGVYRTAKLPSGRVIGPRDTSFSYAMHLEAKR
jgi:hypothetical protein